MSFPHGENYHWLSFLSFLIYNVFSQNFITRIYYKQTNHPSFTTISYLLLFYSVFSKQLTYVHIYMNHLHLMYIYMLCKYATMQRGIVYLPTY